MVDDQMRQQNAAKTSTPTNYKVKVCLPGEEIPESYFQCRYDVLRRPLGFPLGSERLVDDAEAIHAWVEKDGVVLCVGRAHLISEGSDGSAADHAGQVQVPAQHSVHFKKKLHKIALLFKLDKWELCLLVEGKGSGR